MLVDQINLELDEGKPAYIALVDLSVSRTPRDDGSDHDHARDDPADPRRLFGSMAITIIFGLGFASLLTLIVLPVMYSLAFNIKPNAVASEQH